MRPTFTPADWQGMARECADALADLTLKTKRRVTDAEANILLESAAAQLCTVMLRGHVPHPVIESVLDRMAEAYETRLRVLDTASAQTAGRA